MTLPGWLDTMLMVLYVVTIASAIIVVLRENRNPIRSLSWVIALIFLPVVGLVFYIFFGRSLRGRRMVSRHNKRRMATAMTTRTVDLDSQRLDPGEKSLMKLARNIASAVYSVNNSAKIFTSGSAKFEALKHDLRNARKSIFMQYYIFMDDHIGHEIAEILKERALAGVQVKVMYDHIGSFSSSNSFWREMEKAGVDTHPFFRVNFPQLANRLNWRNHRKMVIIDGKVGYIGGMNIADRYDTGNRGALPWRDTHLRVEGDIVESLIFSFIVDWNYLKQPRPLEFPKMEPARIHSGVGMQLVTSGPMSQWDNLSLVFLKAISLARKSIYIQTPYFLPTDALQKALEAAALSKIDVRIMIPRSGDSRMLQYASFSYVTQCLKAGIKVYLYNPGMLHAKIMIIDDNLVTTGSTNFDFRSFENNFECNLLIYDKELNREMRDIFFRDMGSCTRLSYAAWHRRPALQRAWESVIRLVSPIL